MSGKFLDEIDFQVYPVAVDFNPIFWAIECEICGGLVSGGTRDEEEAGRLEYLHKVSHSGLSVAEYKLCRRIKERK